MKTHLPHSPLANPRPFPYNKIIFYKRNGDFHEYTDF